MKKSKLKKQYLLFLVLICISFLGDILRRFSFYMNYEFTRYTSLSKFIFIVVGLIFLSINAKYYFKNNQVKKIFFWALVLVILFITSRLFVEGELDSKIILNNVEYLTKYFFLPFILILFIDLKNSKELINLLIKAFEIVFFINMFAIIIGVVFEIDVFKTYYYGERFGYQGIYSMSGQTSFFFILMIFYYMHKLIFASNDKWTIIKLFLTIIVSLCLGTKRIYFLLPILATYYFIYLNGYKKKSTYLVGALFITLLFLLKEQILVKFTHTITLFYDIYLNNGILSSVTSNRTDLLLNIINNEKQPFLTYLIGGHDFSITRSEMGFFDLWLFFGFIGMIIYLGFYKTLITFKFKHHFYWFCLITLIIIVILTDGFILDTNVPILLFLICSYFNLYERNQKTIDQTVQG